MSITNTLGFEIFVNKYSSISKPIVLLLLGIAFLLAINQLGAVVGILVGSISLMTLGSLIVLLTPLKLINYKSIIFVFVFLFIAEQLTF
ncbi:hypothetical protein [Wenyingzhuangia aestuarii]|uniref:hypothetical protein n=1 Tax=Wenyingzhuangia aestuarii TaxID=1647582 RepID=UPI0014388197|nr:hypothetical protein [Wenyingzhuangia aestuarii]NJB82669.1 hypothetical protein [Wenyingzhuangia aestuarii]